MEGRALRPRNLNVNYNVSLPTVLKDVLPSIRHSQKPSSPSIKIPPTHSLPASISTPIKPKLSIRGQKPRQAVPRRATKIFSRISLLQSLLNPPLSQKKSHITKNHSASALQLSLPELPDFELLEHSVPLQREVKLL